MVVCCAVDLQEATCLVCNEGPKISTYHYVPVWKPSFIQLFFQVSHHIVSILLKVFALRKRRCYALNAIFEHVIGHIHWCLHLSTPHHLPFWYLKARVRHLCVSC